MKKYNKTPKLRFSGYTDDWEQRKFSEFTFPAGERNKKNFPLEAYSITNEQGFVPQKDAHNEFGYMKNTDRTILLRKIHLLIIQQELMLDQLDITKVRKTL